MSQTALTEDQFVLISSALTGIAASDLKPKLDPIGIAGQYFTTLTHNLSPRLVNALADAFPPAFQADTAAAAALDDPQLGPVCGSIMKLWLLGTWYPPIIPPEPEVVSSQAYKESLIWKVMQSHPMGYSMFTFGYWENDPPALDKFIKFADSGNNS